MDKALLMAAHGELTGLMRGESPGLTAPSLCFSTACTDKELRNLASRLKDWFGALHEDANRVIKPTSPDTAQGSKTIALLLICFILNATFPQVSNTVELAIALGENTETLH